MTSDGLQARHDRAMARARERMRDLVRVPAPTVVQAADPVALQRRRDVAALRKLGVLDDDPLYDDPRLLARMPHLPAMHAAWASFLPSSVHVGPPAIDLHGAVDLRPLPCPGCVGAVIPAHTTICIDVTPPPCDKLLETYAIDSTDDEIGLEFAKKRAVNNGHAQLATYDATRSADVMVAVAVDGVGNLVLWKLDETGATVLDEGRFSPLDAVPAPPGFPLLAGYTFPALADLGGGDILVTWLQEHRDTLDNAVFQVCAAIVATPSDLPSAYRVAVAVSTDSPLAPAGWAAGAGGWKYLTAAGAAGKAVIAWTEWDSYTLGSRQDVRARYVVLNGLYGLAALNTMQFLTDNPAFDPAGVGFITRRSSDSSVAVDPTGTRAILVWEEETETAFSVTVLGTRYRFEANRTYLWFMVLALDTGTADPAGPVMDIYGPVVGGDVGVDCTEERVFLGNQLESGAVVMLRANSWEGLALDDEWTILSPAGGSSLGRGWLAGVSAWQYAPGYPSFVFVVWESTKADLLDNDTKSVDIAFVDDTSGTFEVTTRSFGPACGCVYFRLSPSGMVTPSDTGTASDSPQASVFWFEVHEAIASATLRLRTFPWKGTCLPLS